MPEAAVVPPRLLSEGDTAGTFRAAALHRLMRHDAPSQSMLTHFGSPPRLSLRRHLLEIPEYAGTAPDGSSCYLYGPITRTEVEYMAVACLVIEVLTSPRTPVNFACFREGHYVVVPGIVTHDPSLTKTAEDVGGAVTLSMAQQQKWNPCAAAGGDALSMHALLCGAAQRVMGDVTRHIDLFWVVDERIEALDVTDRRVVCVRDLCELPHPRALGRTLPRSLFMCNRNEHMAVTEVVNRNWAELQYEMSVWHDRLLSRGVRAVLPVEMHAFMLRRTQEMATDKRFWSV